MDKEQKIKNRRLFVAIKNNKKEEVEKALTAGADVNAVDDITKEPFFVFVARKGFLDIAKILVENGANVNISNDSGSTALHRACANGKSDIVDFLSKQKDINLDAVNKKGHTALMETAIYNKVKCAEYLIKSGASVDIEDEKGLTVLHHSSHYGSVGVSKLAVEAKANINAKDKKGNVPAYYASKAGNLSVIDLFVEAKANLNEQNKKGEGVLHGVAMYGDSLTSGQKLKVYNKLLKSGVNPKTTDKKYKKPSFYEKNEQSIKLLEKYEQGEEKAELKLKKKKPKDMIYELKKKAKAR